MRAASSPLPRRGSCLRAKGHQCSCSRSVCANVGFLLQGPRVALRRWFSWLHSATFNLQCWHARLLAIVYIGMRLGVYTSVWDCPFWSTGGDLGQQPPEEASDEEQQQALVAAPAAVSAAASSSGDPMQAPRMAENQEHGVKAGEEEIKDLRNKCRNTLFMCAAILSKEGLQTQVKLLVAFSRPVFDAHSRHASEVRSPEEVFNYYLAAATGSWQDPLKQVCKLLTDLPVLEWVGFQTTRLHRLAKEGEETSRELQDQDGLAKQAFDYVVALLHFRAASMSWHSSWPGKLPLFGSEAQEDQDGAWTELASDWAAFQRAKELCGSSTFLQKVTKRSPFSCTLMAEVAQLVCSDQTHSQSAKREQLKQQSQALFKGWGQTKVVEDALKELRDVQDRTVTNKRLEAQRQWLVLKGTGTIAAHRREEVEPEEEEQPTKKRLAWSNFSCRGTAPSLDLLPLLQPATWPTLSAQSLQLLSAERNLLKECLDKDSWGQADECWKSTFVPAGTVLQHAGDGALVLALGHLHYVAQLAWQLDALQGNGQETFYSLCHEGPADPLKWVVLLDWESWMVVPTAPVSPARQKVLQGGKLAKVSGVLLHRTGEPVPILKHAARNAFWQLSSQQLRKLAEDQGLSCNKGAGAYELVRLLVLHILGPQDDSTMDDIMSLRGLLPPDQVPPGLDESIVEAVAGHDAVDALRET